ncbi:MAG: type II secretion system F family protein [Chloroflexi bacterium]|nr:type II secretion system F family protein [Chloroflexota bacterium]
MAIKYVAYNWRGERIQGVLDTESEATAYEMLERDKLIPYRLQAERRRRSLVQLAPYLFQPKEQTIIDFTRQLSVLLRTGINLREALLSFLEETADLGLREALRQIIHDIEAGEAFSQACSRHPWVFPGFYVRLLGVGEAAGQTATVLYHLSEMIERQKSVKDRVKAALLQPALTLAVAAIAMYVLMTQSLPALVKMLGEFGGELPASTKILLQFANFMGQSGAVVSFFPVLVVLVLLASIRTRPGIEARDWLLLRMPLVGKIVVNGNMFSLVSTLGAMLRGGVPPFEALAFAKQAVGNTQMRNGLEVVSRQVSSGERLSVSFRQQKVFPPILSQGIATGEASGSLPEVLSSLTDYYEKQTERSIRGATELIQPIVIMVVAGIVGFVAVAVISALYSSLGSIK